MRFIPAKSLLRMNDAPSPAKAPARPDGPSLDRRLRLDSGLGVRRGVRWKKVFWGLMPELR
jgi:hypothetical protein